MQCCYRKLISMMVVTVSLFCHTILVLDNDDVTSLTGLKVFNNASRKTSTHPASLVQHLQYISTHQRGAFLWKCVLIAYNFLQSVCMNLICQNCYYASNHMHQVHCGTQSSIQFCFSSQPGNQQLFSLWLPGLCVSGGGTRSGTELLVVMHWISPAVLYLCLSSSCRINFPPSFPPRYVLHVLPLVVFGGKWVIWQKKKEEEGGKDTPFYFSESEISNNLPRRVFESLLERDTLMGCCVVQSQPVKRFFLNMFWMMCQICWRNL